jgi:hypothetical protein
MSLPVNHPRLLVLGLSVFPACGSPMTWRGQYDAGFDAVTKLTLAYLQAVIVAAKYQSP